MSKIVTCDQNITDSKEKLEKILDQVLDVFSKGELLVYPTETLYGLGANPFNERALKRLFLAKKRPISSPVSVGVADLRMMSELVWVNKPAKEICKKLLPGPITMLLKAKTKLPGGITSKDNKVGIRIPDHPLALKIIKKVGPITATSANIHGLPEPRVVETACNQLGEEVKLYVDCGVCKFQGPSTIIDITDSNVSIIRQGVVSTQAIESIVKDL